MALYQGVERAGPGRVCPLCVHSSISRPLQTPLLAMRLLPVGPRVSLDTL